MLEQEDGILKEGESIDNKTDEEFLKDKEEETSSESSTEIKSKENATAGEKADNIPFHKHPRFQEVIAQKNELFEKNKLLEERLSRLEQTKIQEEIPLRPDWFTKLYGEDDDAWGLYYQNEVQREKEREERVYSRIKKETEEEQSKMSLAEKEANDYIENSIQDLVDEGNKFDRNELVSIMKEFTPTDENNNLDFRKGLKILQQIKKPNTEKITARKEVASSTVSQTKTIGGEKPFGTSINLRNKSFSSLANDD
jgi:hypothetical protein